MRTENYISFVYKDEKEKHDSPFQYIATHPKAFYENNTQELRNELNKYFFWMLYESDIEKSEKFSFLDYHLMKYNGHGMDLLDFVKNSPMQPMKVNAPIEMELLRREQCRSYLYEWVVKKEQAGVPEPFDPRIKGKLSKIEIENYFITKFFHTKDKKGVPYFSEEEIRQFLYANFIDFKPRREIIKLKSPAMYAQAYIRRTVYAFYIKHRIDEPGEQRRYCEMLRDNFQEFDNSGFEEGIMSNFSR